MTPPEHAGRATTVAVANRLLTLELDSVTGRIAHLRLEAPRAVTWNRHPGNLTIRDDRLRRDYDETRDHCLCNVRRRSALEVMVEKHFADSAFTVKEIWRAEPEAIRWRLELEANRDAEPRSVEIRQRIPWGDNNFGLYCWTAHPDFPAKLSAIVGHAIEYGDPNYGTMLPLLALYRPDQKIGLSIAMPLGLRMPRLRFHVPHWHAAGIEVRFSLLRLDAGTKATAELLFTAHAACWRPALKWFSDLYPEYFRPPNPDVRRLEGGYIISSPGDPITKLALARDHGVKFTEVHNHFPVYGNYVPDEPEWPNILTREDPNRPEARIVSPALIRQHCRNAWEHGIVPLLYFQCAGDGDIPYVTEHFPDSVAVTPAGMNMSVWIKCWLMNADAATSFGRHIRRQIAALFVRYPEIGGVFLDQLCYSGYDMAHDDGMTMVANRPAYKLACCYHDAIKCLSQEVHRRGKYIIGNGPYDVEVQRDVDGHMAEGLSRTVALLAPLCIRKPLLFYANYTTPEKAEEMFRQCLLAGASYSINPACHNDVIERLCRAYIPLVSRLFGRQWLLEAHPLVLPEDVEGNIFKGEDGSVLITLLRSRRSLLDNAMPIRPIDVGATFSAAREVENAVMLATEHVGEKPLPFAREGEYGIRLRVPQGVASVIVLKGACKQQPLGR